MSERCPEHAAEQAPEHAAEHPAASTSRAGVLAALVNGSCLAAVVPLALDTVERDPLASAGCFPGDMLRGLMEVPGDFWGRFPELFDRYRKALRAGAAARHRLPPDERMVFWTPLDATAAACAAAAERGARAGHTLA
jgi:hypothetical protein